MKLPSALPKILASPALIRQIQSLVGVTSDGVYGRATQNALFSRFSLVAGSDFEDLQYKIGAYPVDNIFGSNTAREIIEELSPASPLTATPSNNPIARITVPLLDAVSTNSPTFLAGWVEPLQKACIRFNINTARRVAAWIAQLAHESDLKPRTENLNYSQAGLRSTFGEHRISDADCLRLGRKPGAPALSLATQAEIANLVYGGEYGRKNLGNTSPTDGWDFRGVGPLQVTGRANITAFALYMGLTLDEALTYVRTLEGGIMCAGWFWEANKINLLADTPGVEDETRKINGGTNGLEHRRSLFNTALALLNV